MKKIFLTGVLFCAAAIGLTACADSNTYNRNNAPSNANSAVLNSNNSNTGANTANNAH
jgi:hypothetical protein